MQTTSSSEKKKRKGNFHACFGQIKSKSMMSNLFTLYSCTRPKFTLFSWFLKCFINKNENVSLSITIHQIIKVNLDKIWLQICLELSFSTHYMTNYKTIHIHYLNKPRDLTY